MKNTNDAIIVDFLGVSWVENGNYYIVPGKDNLQISSSNDIDTVIINNLDMMMENMPNEGTVRIISMQDGAIKAYDMSSENMKKLMLSYGNKRGRLNSQKTLSEIINNVAEDIAKNPRAFSDAISDSTAQVTIQKNTADETEAQNAFKSFFNKFKKKVAAAVVATTIFLNGLVPFAQAEKYEDLAAGYEAQVAEMVGYIANNPLNPQPDNPKGTPDAPNDSSDIRNPQGAVNTMNDILSRGYGRNTTVDEQSNEAGFRNDSPDLDPATRDIRTPQGAVNTLNDIFIKGSGKNLEQLMEESGFMPSSPAAGASRATLINSTIPANEALLFAGNSQEPIQEISIVSVRKDTPDTTLAQILRSKESNIFNRCSLFALMTLPANTLKSELGEALANKKNEHINAPGANKYEINRIFIEYYTNMLFDYTKNIDKVKKGNVIGESLFNYGLEVPRDLMLNILFDEGTRMVTTISGKYTVKRDGKTVTVNLPNEANIMFGLYALQNLYGNSYTEQLQNKVKRSDIKFSREEIAKMHKQGEHDPLMAVAAKYFSGDLSMSAMWTTLNSSNFHNSGINVRHDGLHK